MDPLYTEIMSETKHVYGPNENNPMQNYQLRW